MSATYKVLRWYLGRDDLEKDLARVVAGGPLALIGGEHDDVDGFADRLAAERAVLDLTRVVPSARRVRDLFEEAPDTIVLARRPEHVIANIGLIAQPWYMLVSPLTARPDDGIRLLRDAICDLGVTRPLDALGRSLVLALADYPWPRGLREIRETSRRLGALLERGSFTAAARDLAVSRQALSKYVHRRSPP